MKQVAARVKGRLDTLFVNETGQMVHEGHVLASLYSPDLVITVQNLLESQRSQNANGVRRFSKIVLAVVAQAQAVDVDRDARKPARIVWRKPLDADRIGHKKARRSLLRIRRSAYPHFYAHEEQNRDNACRQRDSRDLRAPQIHPRHQ